MASRQPKGWVQMSFKERRLILQNIFLSHFELCFLWSDYFSDGTESIWIWAELATLSLKNTISLERKKSIETHQIRYKFVWLPIKSADGDLC